MNRGIGRTAAGWAIALPALALAADAPKTDSGDTAWLLASAALVLFMMIPGLSLFYAGLVRAKNVLSILAQCYALTAVLSLLWFACGYSLCFSGDGALIGDLKLKFLDGLGPNTPPRSDAPTIPVAAHCAYQMMFFLITPGLFLGAFAERMKFSAILLFSIGWSLLVYAPCCFGIWHKLEFFGLKNVIDLAGGIVVHVTAGVAALVACLIVGPRRGFGKEPMMPHNLPFTIAGAGMLWVGWFGFNAGSQVAANGSAATTLLVTHLSASAATVAWMAIEWLRGKPSALGIATGSIAGLAAITPAAGKVGPLGAVCLGTVSGLVCWWACAKLKQRLKYDDALDVFGVHGVGGLIGSLGVAIVGAKSFFPGALGEHEALPQLKTQLLACGATVVLSAVVSAVLLYALQATIGLRPSASQEDEGLDIADHAERAYNN